MNYQAKLFSGGAAVDVDVKTIRKKVIELLAIGTGSSSEDQLPPPRYLPRIHEVPFCLHAQVFEGSYNCHLCIVLLIMSVKLISYF